MRRDLLTESGKHSATKLLRGIPPIGPIRAAILIALVQTPHRFRTKRQLWSYSGLGIEMHSGAEHCYVDGELQRSKKQISIRGLNRNHNHDLKNLFKSSATLARKIAAITLIVWKKGVRFDAQYLKPQTA